MTKKTPRRPVEPAPKPKPAKGAAARKKSKAKKPARQSSSTAAVSRGSGMALWLQISEELETEIVTGNLQPGTRLPTETELAASYEVNRHTVRRALAELNRKGMVVATPRRGTFVTKPRIPYRIGRQTRFSENILQAGREPGGRPLTWQMAQAPVEMAQWLGIAGASEVVEIRHVRVANDVPICLSTTWFPADRFKRIGPIYERLKSFTRALERLGVQDYARARTRITSRAATTEERELLEIQRGATVMVVESLDVDSAGEPISASHSCFAADRVELMIES